MNVRKVQVEISEETLEEVKELLGDKDRTMSNTIRNALKYYLWLHQQKKEQFKVQAVKEEKDRKVIRELVL